MSIFTVLLFFIGVGLLYAGADALVKGSSHLALSIGIRPLIVGMTVISMGTSFPELAVSLFAGLNENKDIALGNIIGSNIANIGLVVGVSAIIRPLKVQINTVRKEMPFLIGSMGVFYLLSIDGKLLLWDGIVLFLGFIFFMLYLANMAIKDRRYGNELNKVSEIRVTKKETLLNSILIILGLAALLTGSYLSVKSAIVIAEALGVSQIVIAITMIAVGTSLPELVVSGLSAYRGHVDLAIGNVVGSNLFNTLFVIALVSMILPIPVDATLLRFEYPVMLGFTIIFLPMMRTGFVLNRWEGLALLIIYSGFICLFIERNVLV